MWGQGVADEREKTPDHSARTSSAPRPIMTIILLALREARFMLLTHWKFSIDNISV